VAFGTPGGKLKKIANYAPGRGAMSITIRQILDRKGWGVVALKRRQPIPFVAKFLTANKIGAAPVIDEHGSILGMLSERDIMRVIGSVGGEVVSQTAEEVMTPLVATCTPEDTVMHAMGLMTTYRCRHIPVLEAGVLRGLVSIGDVVKSQLEEAEFELASMRAYITAS
jgi:CBS domain-containing protein